MVEQAGKKERWAHNILGLPDGPEGEAEFGKPASVVPNVSPAGAP